MIPTEPGPTVQPGDIGPDFTLPLVSEDGHVSLSGFRGRSPVLLAVLRTIW